MDFGLATFLWIGFAIAVGYLIKKEWSEEKPVEVLYGYPAYSRVWLTVYHYRRSDRWVFETDDLFAEKRPADWPIERPYLFEDRKSGATREEHLEAWRQCKARRLL